MQRFFLGIDVGSVSTNLVMIDGQGDVRETLYLRTQGKPLVSIQAGLRQLAKDYDDAMIAAVGTTGSGRMLADVLVGADVVKNEITTHAAAATHLVPAVRTILEIGGQDSKLILCRDGVVTDFAMNTVCAAGTGSFLDQQAARMQMPIEKLGAMALEAKHAVRIAGRCAVFAESDMIHKQQTGHGLPEIVAGLCAALVRNFLSNLAKGKRLEAPFVFQGGVAANVGMKQAFEEALGAPVIVPPQHGVMGAIGAALLAKEWVESHGVATRFKGMAVADAVVQAGSWECSDCANGCEVIEVITAGSPVARWGDRCGKWAARMTRDEQDVAWGDLAAGDAERTTAAGSFVG
ncbi:acyl-CoA dehydratase activase [Heliophilum fasciatum]|uniref:Putative CoA-substrate-specific enzyme activase n=1 Tax=Heliophilum fasciatum TaxID=35700 RepID=A0A4R2RSJ1_9FIRM|nr:acyl-CoA dehydratase activase [Heliophilum fasciatum]MCW2277374.1 putative CoA-substrate-specific enzyme activase [Heliophilum fasciatum]TCP67210.1 putative CoA-substrate-specific enzyme activase [Heliophilum fasciatum]